ncbi:MAG: alpha-glucosidase [Clostridia bacterium]|nr:alpha-glucosidase [Clostridia bacterium]
MKKEFSDCYDLVVYQIYPRSFKDSNGDGIGDINGILSKLDYLKDLGVNAIWLCPIFKSPQCDNGYDISDYRDIDPIYGTMADFDRLLTVAHEKGIKVIMDFVANHTSSEHEWFRRARSSKSDPYHDYYYWADKPLNDWRSEFGGSAWEYNEPTGEYYLHCFAVGQPDVNWNNPKVREEFKSIVDFWVKKGVDGFRCDVLDHISKDFEKGLRRNGPHLHEYIREVFGRDHLLNLYTVGEAETTEESILATCGQDRRELKSVFQFSHLMVGRKGRYTPVPCRMDEVKDILEGWERFTEERDLLYVLLTDNHDRPWFLSRTGNDRELRYECATCVATMVYLLRGVPFIYEGQEIGCANSHFDDLTAFNDVECLGYYEENKDKESEEKLLAEINFGSRDNSRRPFAWDGSPNHGFTTAAAPWLPYASRSDEINLEADLASEKSIWRYYRDLLALRRERVAFRQGSCRQLQPSKKDCYVYLREYEGERFLVVCNFEREQRFTGLPEGRLLLSNLKRRAGANGVYAPYECAVYDLTNR